MILLQAKVLESTTTALINYGAIGILLAICLIIIYIMGKFFVKQNEKTTDRYEKLISGLTEKLDKYIDQDRNEMIKVIRENTSAFNNMTNVMERLVKQ